MAKAPKKTFTIPKTIGQVADRIYLLKQKRSEIQKQADAIEEEEKFLKEHVVNNLSKQDARGVSGKVANVRVYTEAEPQVKDYDKLYAHILKTKDFSILQKALAKSAIKERWEDGKQVPGVEAFHVVKVSITKV